MKKITIIYQLTFQELIFVEINRLKQYTLIKNPTVIRRGILGILSRYLLLC